jgi:hypothetical protein
VSDNKRSAFGAPKLAGITMHAGHAGPSTKAPKKAGMAESGASALMELEKTMVVPCAKHMYGIGTVEVTASQQQVRRFYSFSRSL